MLKLSGIDFEKFENFGIDVHHFGELLMVSGLVLNSDVKWLSFHSTYDFGYLLKTLTCKDLPDNEDTFMELLQMYFPGIYDVKVIINYITCIQHAHIDQTVYISNALSIYALLLLPVYDDGCRRVIRWIERSG